jgi:hypothetical protein
MQRLRRRRILPQVRRRGARFQRAYLRLASRQVKDDPSVLALD